MSLRSFNEGGGHEAKAAAHYELFYWSSRNREVDFVLSRRKSLVALEVKSGRRKVTLPGIEAFSKEFRVGKKLLVGAQGIPVEEFLLTPPPKWLS